MVQTWARPPAIVGVGIQSTGFRPQLAFEAGPARPVPANAIANELHANLHAGRIPTLTASGRVRAPYARRSARTHVVQLLPATADILHIVNNQLSVLGGAWVDSLAMREGE